MTIGKPVEEFVSKGNQEAAIRKVFDHLSNEQIWDLVEANNIVIKIDGHRLSKESTLEVLPNA